VETEAWPFIITILVLVSVIISTFQASVQSLFSVKNRKICPGFGFDRLVAPGSGSQPGQPAQIARILTAPRAAQSASKTACVPSASPSALCLAWPIAKLDV
jgi:hypothetical protein